MLLRFVLGPGGLEGPGGSGKAQGETRGTPRWSPEPPGPGPKQLQNLYLIARPAEAAQLEFVYYLGRSI